LGKRKVTNQSDTAQCDSRLPPDSQNSCKKLKRISDVVTVISDDSKNLNLGGCDENKHINTCEILDKSIEHTSDKPIAPSSTCHDEHDKGVVDGSKAVTNETELKNSLSPMEEQIDGMLGFSYWKPLEKELYLKGVEMFGRNRYLSFCILSHTIKLRHARVA
jgi:histone-lysine N-methyltransferase EZH2